MSRKNISDLQVCLAYKRARELRDLNRNNVTDHVWPEDLLAALTGQPVKVCLRAMERAADRGYIDWGVSLRSGWLTEKGVELIGNVMKIELELSKDMARSIERLLGRRYGSRKGIETLIMLAAQEIARLEAEKILQDEENEEAEKYGHDLLKEIVSQKGTSNE